jgi:calcineurin-like phosphoesterase family protein
MKYYTSDTHFGHENIIRFCNRPFSSVDEMAEGLIDRWNSVVRPYDEVYHLGDFAFRNKESVAPIIERLNGIKFLIVGNHDHRSVMELPHWEWVKPYAEIKDEGTNVVLFHYAIREWHKKHHGAYHLFGHSHGGLPPHGNSLDVGVDCWDWRPVTLSQVRERISHSD